MSKRIQRVRYSKRNDVELAASGQIVTALAELGVTKVLEMAAYGLHANRMGRHDGSYNARIARRSGLI